MNAETLADIRNKLTVPMVALERLEKGADVPQGFLDLALKELVAGFVLIQKLNSRM